MNENKHVLLSVLAHPDDESFGMGGTLALYADKGVEVHLICATRGEVGEVGPEHLKGFQSIGDLRESELKCAACHLGLNKVHFLDYRDSGMTGSSENNNPKALCKARTEEVALKIANIIREIKPQVVLTFDPVGGYYHPDHIAIHKATVEGFYLAGNPEYLSSLPPYMPDKLFYHTIPKQFIRIALRLIRLAGKDPSKWGENKDIDLTLIAENDFPIHAQINYRSVEKQKQAASFCHASQGGVGLVKGPIGWISRFLGGKDQYMQAYPPPLLDKCESDLFAGI